MRSAPGSKTDQTMSRLAALRVELVAEAEARKQKAHAHRAGASKSAAKRAAKRARQSIEGNTSPIEVPIGSTRPGEVPKFATGSIQVMPPSGKVSRPKGYRLKAWSDFIPGSPGDWTDPERTNSFAGSRAVLKPHWSSNMADRQPLPSEQAKVAQRSFREQREYDADRVQGFTQFQTGAQRDHDDVARGVFRDGLGRVMRTSDMEDCEVERVMVTRQVKSARGSVSVEVEEFRRLSGRTAREHATQHGLPTVRPLSRVVNEEDFEKKADRADRRADKADMRADKKAARTEVQAQRKARSEENSEAREHNRAASKKLRDLARQILAARGIDKPTPVQIRGMLEFFETNMQRAQYARDMQPTDLAVAA